MRCALVTGVQTCALPILLGNLSVQPRENTDVVDVHFTATATAIARRVADRLVSVFQSANDYSAQSDSRASRPFVEAQLRDAKIGRASCRERVSQSVYLCGVAVSLKKTRNRNSSNI